MSQVHRAVLPDGREVALKVQRPGLREQMTNDLEALADVAAFVRDHTEFGARFGVDQLFAEFRKSLLREMDFRQETMHLLTISANLRDIAEIVIPQPVIGYCTSRVLAMELIAGTKITELGPLQRIALDGDRLADALLRAYLKQILCDGMFHADPHPGNVFLLDGRIALIDLGMVARVNSALQDRLLQLLLAISDNRPDDAAEVLLLVAECGDEADHAGFRRGVTELLAQHHEMSFEPPQVGRAMLLLLKVAGEHGMRLPIELAMIGKTLLNLDEIGRILAPHFDANAAIRRHAAGITEQQMVRELSIGSLFSTAVEAKNFIQQLPGRVNRILDHLAENRVKVRVDALDEARLMEGLQKVANRIATGLVLAALIVGAALMMDVPTSFQLFGYPGLAILLFLGAAGGGLVLVATILGKDVKAKGKVRSP